MVETRVTRTVDIPDALRISRYRKVPELGPRILFFSGGTALNGLSNTLKNYTHNSIHLVTPFDSGGSSAELRRAFDMPAVGDLRSRLMALADETVLGHPEIYKLFTYRFPKDANNDDLYVELEAMAQGNAIQVAAISEPMRTMICDHLGYFVQAMPNDFDLRGASIGNLILAGGYLHNHQDLEPVVYLFSKLVNVQGTVRMVVDDNLHLGAHLADGSKIIGQHMLTGKEVSPISSSVSQVFLSESAEYYLPTKAKIHGKSRDLIEQAELICYPPGSFYSSIIANLIPNGVGSAIAANDCPKVYVPNLGSDPEQLGMSLEQNIYQLLTTLKTDVGDGCPMNKLLNFVLIDSQHCRNDAQGYEEAQRMLREHGIEMIDMDLVSEGSAPYYDNDLLVSALLSLT